MMDDLFGLERGKELRDEGITKIKDNHEAWLILARSYARGVARNHGFVTSDDLHEGFPPPANAHPNVMGAVFKGAGLVPCGYQPSKRASAHARIIRKWRLP